MEYEEVASVFDKLGDEEYIGRIVKRRSNTFEKIFCVWHPDYIYYLEVQNMDGVRIKRKKIGNAGVREDDDYSIPYGIEVQSIDFTENGLEAVIKDGIIECANLTEPKTFLIPREKFLNS